MVRLVAARLGPVQTTEDDALEPDATFETMPSVLFDAVVVPDGEAGAKQLASLGHALEFVKDHSSLQGDSRPGRRCAVSRESRLPVKDDSTGSRARCVTFVDAVGKHRNWDRGSDPPIV